MVLITNLYQVSPSVMPSLKRQASDDLDQAGFAYDSPHQEYWNKRIVHDAFVDVDAWMSDFNSLLKGTNISAEMEYVTRGGSQRVRVNIEAGEVVHEFRQGSCNLYVHVHIVNGSFDEVTDVRVMHHLRQMTHICPCTQIVINPLC